jgi:hypothetical protein
MHIELEIEGVTDRTITDEITKRVRKLGQSIDRSEEWRVRLAPSEARGEWDLGIRHASGWHLTSSTRSVELLPDLVERTLRERLVREHEVAEETAC